MLKPRLKIPCITLALVLLTTGLGSLCAESIFDQKGAHQLETPRFEEGELPFQSAGPGAPTPGLTQPDRTDTETPTNGGEAEELSRGAERPLVEYIKAYAGRWVGTMEIRTLDGQLVNTFDVEQQYWWNEEAQKLESLAVFDDAGILRYAQSSNYIDSGIIYSEVEEAHENKIYKAKIDGDTLIWLPMDKQRALDHQLKQRIYSTGEGVFMENKGYERYKRGVIDKMLLLSGTLRKDGVKGRVAEADTAQPKESADAPARKQNETPSQQTAANAPSEPQPLAETSVSEPKPSALHPSGPTREPQPSRPVATMTRPDTTIPQTQDTPAAQPTQSDQAPEPIARAGSLSPMPAAQPNPAIGTVSASAGMTTKRTQQSTASSTTAQAGRTTAAPLTPQAQPATQDVSASQPSEKAESATTTPPTESAEQTDLPRRTVTPNKPKAEPKSTKKPKADKPEETESQSKPEEKDKQPEAPKASQDGSDGVASPW